MGNFRHLKRELAKSLDIYRWSRGHMVPDVTDAGMTRAREAAKQKKAKQETHGQTTTN